MDLLRGESFLNSIDIHAIKKYLEIFFNIHRAITRELIEVKRKWTNMETDNSTYTLSPGNDQTLNREAIFHLF